MQDAWVLFQAPPPHEALIQNPISLIRFHTLNESSRPNNAAIRRETNSLPNFSSAITEQPKLSQTWAIFLMHALKQMSVELVSSRRFILRTDLGRSRL